MQLSYAIGVAEPLSIYVDTYGTGKKTDEELVQIIRNNWDLRPGVIGAYCQFYLPFRFSTYFAVRELNLQKPQYLKTASYGHFGRCLYFENIFMELTIIIGNPDYTWEKPKQLKL